jgi:hypothetical protein
MAEHLPPHTWKVAAVISGFIAICAAVGVTLVLFLPRPAWSRTLYPGQWDSVSAETREWFLAQTNPKTGVPCCNSADGVNAEEEQCPGGAVLLHPEFKCPPGDENVWVRFVVKSSPQDITGQPIDWMIVPPDTILPSSHGVATVWWYLQDGKIGIRCFARGPRS